MKYALVLLAILLAGRLSPAAAIEIVYPEEGTWVSHSNFLIIKGGNQPPLDALTIEINGVKSDLIEISAPEYRAAFGDLLILQPEFDAGKNRIGVEGYVKGKKVADAKAAIYFLADPLESPPDAYRRFVLHSPEKEKICAGCHNMNPEPKELAVAGRQNPCASCHRRQLDKKHVHGPPGVWSCAYCHPGNGKPSRYQARAGEAKVCNECHADKVREYLTNKFVHGPVEAGQCTICHDPHASDNPAQLVLPVNALCLGCHAEVGKGVHVVRGVGGKGHPLKGVPDPLTPGQNLSCASCHDPHGGMASTLFRRGITSRFALCGVCHKK